MSKMTTDSEESAVQIILTLKNYQRWLKQQRIRCSKLYGKQANVLKNNVRYTYPAVVAADYTPPLGAEQAPLNPPQLRKLRLKSEEDRNGREQKLVDNEPRFYSTLWDSISVESQEIIRVRPEFPAADLEQDPNLLFLIIRATHLLEMAGGPEMVMYERIKKQMEFMAFHQGGTETLGEFKVEYMERRATLTAAGIAAPLPAEDALWFLLKLDQSRHGDMINKLTNDALRGTAWPATIDAAYLQASTWRVQEPRRNFDTVPAVYVIADQMTKGKKKAPAGKKTTSPSSPETRKCFACEKTGHLAKDCPDLARHKATANLALMTTDARPYALYDDDDDSDDGYRY